MKISKQLLVIFSLLSLIYARKQNLAVLQFKAANVPYADVLILNNRFQSELVNSGDYIVLERQMINDVLKEQGFQQTGCVTNECAVEVGKLLGVDRIIVGTIGRLESLLTISVRMIDIETGEIIKQVDDECDCKLEDFFGSTIKKTVYKLLGKSTYPTSIEQFDYEKFEKYKIMSARIQRLKGRDMTNKEFKIFEKYLLFDVESIITIIDTSIWQKTPTR